MRRFIRTGLVLSVLSFLIIVLNFCCTSEQVDSNTDFLNLHDSVKYVGIQTCKQCHSEIYASFIQTGMGQSFNLATRAKSAADFSKKHLVYDRELDFWYSPYWKNDSLYIKEFRLKGTDTIFSKTQKINYIIGSGQHTNSHIYNSNGYLFQAPLTYYAQKGNWDLPPGFEKGFSSRFNRLIGLECMSCHNGYPEFVKGSENKFNSVPNGIDCERCHGPGELHVAEKQKGVLVDTSKAIDYTIVNPGKLSIERQFDLCQRCHLQGNAVLKEGKSFYDFKPGMQLKDVMHVFLPRYEESEHSFIMASHADRLKQSACFIQSAKKKSDKKALRPYKNALTCVTCHNPHVSVKQTNSEVFIQKCNSCHSSNAEIKCSEKEKLRLEKRNNCITCHMPVSGSEDIPHVSIHDHFIRKRPEPHAVANKGAFKGLVCINDPKPDRLTQARAYLQQFEKFEPQHFALLDSASIRLPGASAEELKANFAFLVQLYYLKQEYGRVIELTNRYGANELLDRILKRKSWSNEDAWTAYRIGEAYLKAGDGPRSYSFYKLAYQLAPYYFEFANKYGNAAMLMAKPEEATGIFEKLVAENPGYAPGISNLGYLRLLLKRTDEAERLYARALALDPDYIPALLNMAGLYISKNENLMAKIYLKRVLTLQPENKQASSVLKTL
jgi:hypothetical protein